MERPIIKLQKERDFNALISDTFEFIRQEIKPLGQSLLTYAGPFILITAFLGAMYQSSVFTGFGDLEKSNNPFGFLQQMYGIKYQLYIMSSAISQVILTLVIYGYIYLYATRGKDNFSPEDVWRMVGKHFIPVFFMTLALGIIIALGFVAFIIPGIFLAVALTFTIYAKIAEGLSFGDAMRRSINLVKDYWWLTFGVLIIIYFIASFSGSIFLIPQMVMIFLKSFSAAKGEVSNPGILFMIVSSAGTFIATFFYSVIYITITLHYYNLVEKKDKPSLMDEINQIK